MCSSDLNMNAMLEICKTEGCSDPAEASNKQKAEWEELVEVCKNNKKSSPIL